MLADILARLRGKKGVTSRDLQAALDKINIPALGEAVLAAENARREAIVSGDVDEELDRHDAAVEAASKALRRAEVAKAELEARLAEAMEREAADALTREKEEVDREAERVARDLRERWPEHQRALVELLERLDAAERKVKAVNEKLHEAGRGDEVLRQVEFPRARPYPDGQWHGAISITRTNIPAVQEWGAPGHGHLPQPPAFWSNASGTQKAS